MKMNKFIIIGGTSLLFVCSAIVLGNKALDVLSDGQNFVEASATTHNHECSSDWSSDDVYHWHDSTCEHDYIKDYAHHSFGNWITSLEPTEYKLGKEYRECSVCHYIEIRELPVLEHEHTYSNEWSFDDTYHWHDSLCGLNEKQSFATHSFGDWFVKKEARDEIEGLEVRICSECGFTEKRTIEALPHIHIPAEREENRIEPTCTKQGSYDVVSYCLDCGGELSRVTIPIDALGHDIVHHAAQAPTCTTVGWNAYDTCSRCDYSTYVEIPKKGHVNTATRQENIVPSTCTESGSYDLVTYCKDDNVVLNTEYITTDPLGHDLIHHAAQAPTCTAVGWNAYDTCSRCDYSTYVEIPELGHDIVHHAAQAPTCTTVGWNAYDTCSRCDYSTYVEIPELGHSYGEVEYVWNIDYSSCTATRICNTDNSHVDQETVDSTYSVIDAPTYDTKGTGRFTAEFENENFSSVTHDVSINKLERVAYQLNEDGVSYSASATSTAVSGKVTIDSTYNDLPVTSIADNGFKDCTLVTSVTIPSSIITIGENAFYGCEGLSSIKIPTSVTTIGISALENCSSLSSITIPFVGGSVDENTYFGYIFGGPSSSHSYYYIPSSLTTVTISNGCVSIEEDAFNNCPNIQTVNIPKSVQTIKDNAFRNCQDLTTISFSSNSTLSSIGYEVFYGCHNLASITLPSSLETIGIGAFSGCSSLTSIVIPSNVTSIRNGLFNGCTSLKNVIIPNNVTSIGSNAFSNCTSITSIKLPTNLTSLGEYSFSGCTGITSITFPSTLESIGGRAFSGCTGLTTVTVPTSVTTIGVGAFGGCSSLTSMTLPFVGYSQTTASQTHFGVIFGANNYRDNNASVPASLKTVTISNGCTSIGNNAFYGCTMLTSITLPNTVTSIGNNAFNGCTGITSMTLPAGLTSLGNNAFSNCSSLATISINNGLVSIGNNAFSNCTSITNIYVPFSVTSIGSGAFSGCSSLTTMTLPFVGSAVNYEGDNYTTHDLFGYIFGTTSYTGGVATQQQSRSGTKITYYIPKNLTNITITGSENSSLKINAFYGCSGIKEVTMYQVPHIPPSAFYNCSGLTTLNISKTVKSINANAFYGCSKLTQIEFLGKKSDWNSINLVSGWNSKVKTIVCADGNLSI